MKTHVKQLKKPQERIPVELAYPECFHESFQFIRRKEVSDEVLSLVCFCKSFCPVCHKNVNILFKNRNQNITKNRNFFFSITKCI